MIEELLLGN